MPAVTDYPGDGVGALQGRENSLQPGQVREGVQCLPISHCFIQYATRVLQVSMLGPDPWIIEPGRHAVGGLHLAVRVLEQIAEAAVEHARPPARERGGVPPRGEPLPRRLDPHELHVAVVQECGEDPHRVRSAADTRRHRARQAAVALQGLGPRLATDHRLIVAHDAGERIRTHHGADDVMCRGDVRDPIAQRFVGGVLERARAGRHRHHPRPHQLHAVHVQALAAHVLLAHIDHAVEPEAGAHRGRGDAVLARARLGDNARFAHAPGQEHLPQRVVDLVRPVWFRSSRLSTTTTPGPTSAPSRGVSVSGVGRPT